MGAQVRGSLLVEAVDAGGRTVGGASRAAPGAAWTVWALVGEEKQTVARVDAGVPEVLGRRLVLAAVSALAGEGGTVGDA